MLVQQPRLVDQIVKQSKAEISLACLSCLCLLDLSHNLLDPGCEITLLDTAASVRDTWPERRGHSSCLQLRKGSCTHSQQAVGTWMTHIASITEGVLAALPSPGMCSVRARALGECSTTGPSWCVPVCLSD